VLAAGREARRSDASVVERAQTRRRAPPRAVAQAEAAAAAVAPGPDGAVSVGGERVRRARRERPHAIEPADAPRQRRDLGRRGERLRAVGGGRAAEGAAKDKDGAVGVKGERKVGAARERDHRRVAQRRDRLWRLPARLVVAVAEPAARADAKRARAAAALGGEEEGVHGGGADGAVRARARARVLGAALEPTQVLQPTRLAGRRRRGRRGARAQPHRVLGRARERVAGGGRARDIVGVRQLRQGERQHLGRQALHVQRLEARGERHPADDGRPMGQVCQFRPPMGTVGPNEASV
jgi:hypothetical protein